MRPEGMRARRALFVFFVLAAGLIAASMWPAAASQDAVREYCYVVADHTHAVWEDDMLSRVDTGVFSPASNETTIGTIKGLNIEAIALKPNTKPPVLYAFSGGTLGILDTNTAKFTAIGSLGSGNGPLGNVRFSDTDGLTFDPHTLRLYASIRRDGPDLLVEVNPATGARVAGAFGGADYAVVQKVAGLDDIDDITIGGRPTDVVGGRFPMWAIANQGGKDPRLIKINRSGDAFTGAVTDVGATLVKDIEGLSWGNTGLWATTGKSNSIEGVWEVNPVTGLASNPRVLDNAIDYESLACPPPATLDVVVGPKTALNQTASLHSVKVTVTKDEKPQSGIVPTLKMTGVGEIVSNGCASGTDSNGVCTVTVRSHVTGTTTLEATVTTSVGQSTLATKSDSGSTSWIGFDNTSACLKAPIGALIPYTLGFVVGQELANVDVTATLPSHLVFSSASPINGVTPSAPAPGARGGTISWRFDRLPAGAYSTLVKARVAVGVPVDTGIVNTLRLTHNGQAIDKSHVVRVVSGLPGIDTCALPVEIEVAPKLGLNLLQGENTFTVTVRRDGAPAAGVKPRTELITTGSVVRDTCASGTDAQGRCTVELTSLVVGTGVLTATDEVQVGEGKVTATDTGTMVWVDLDIGLPCLGAPLGALVPYTVTFTTGHELRDVTVTDRLPNELVFQSAAPINGVQPVTPAANEAGGGTVSWTFDRLPAGTYTGKVYARIGLDVLNNTKITNAATFAHGGLSVSKVRTMDVLELPTGGLPLPLPLPLNGGLPELCPLPLEISVQPKLGLDLLGDEHVFTIRLLQDGKPAVGAKPHTDILGTGVLTGAIETNRCATDGTDAEGRCTVTLKSALPGTAILTASHELQIGPDRIRVSDVGTMVWVGLSKDTICTLLEAPPTTPIPYKVSFKIGDDLTNVTVRDRLPSSLRFVSAGAINGVKPTTPALGDAGGTVSWFFPRLPAGEYSALVNAVVGTEALPGLEVGNVIEFVLESLSVEARHTLTVVKPDAIVDALGYGIAGELPLAGKIARAPSTAPAGHGSLASVANPLPGTSGPLAEGLHVREFSTTTDQAASASGIATSGVVDLNIPGVVRVQADGAVARSTSNAGLVSATSTAAGSTIKNLRVDGVHIGDVSEPTTLTIRDRLTGAAIGEVRLLERIPMWAAAGEKQPADGFFRSGLGVNAIRVVLRDIPATPRNEAAELIVAHAESSAKFTSGIGCLDDLLEVVGGGLIAAITGVVEDAGDLVVGDVVLPRTGGWEREALAHLDLPVGTAGLSTSETSGVVSIPQQKAQTEARAHLTDLDLLDGLIAADAIEATTRADLSSLSGATRISKLAIAGIDVCGAAAACSPAPDTVLMLPGAGPVLVVLNEQARSAHGITVTAVHVYVLGDDNALGLPAGAELVIGRATSAASRA